MAIEIEAKMRLRDRGAMIEKIESLGGKRVAELSETNSYFDTPKGTLKSSDQGLRIRVEVVDAGKPSEKLTAKITHKGPRAMGALKSRFESELIVNNAKEAAALLSALGYHHVLSFEKRRLRFELDSCLVELDELPIIGLFIEIEGPTEAAVIDVRAKLGLAEEPVIRSSYIAMLQTHLQESHTETAMIRFEDDASVVKC